MNIDSNDTQISLCFQVQPSSFGDSEVERCCYSQCQTNYCLCFLLEVFFLMFIFDRERERERARMSGGGAERGRHRIWSRLQAPSCQHRARCGAPTHEPWDHDLSRSQKLNQLSHPGAPRGDCILIDEELWHKLLTVFKSDVTNGIQVAKTQPSSIRQHLWSCIHSTSVSR